MLWSNTPLDANTTEIRCLKPNTKALLRKAARKHRGLAGCKREGAVCICKTINFLTKSFITNEQYELRNAESYYFMYICVHISIYLKFLMNNLFSCCFEIVLLAPCCWLCHLSSDGLVESERHRSQKIRQSSKENRSKWVLFRIAIYHSSGYNPIFCPAVSVELPGVLMFWNPKDIG